MYRFTFFKAYSRDSSGSVKDTASCIKAFLCLNRKKHNCFFRNKSYFITHVTEFCYENSIAKSKFIYNIIFLCY